MGQKVNATIFRAGLKNAEYSFKYTTKNSEESSIFLYKNIEIQSYINKIFKDFNIFVKNCKIEHTTSQVKILIFFFPLQSQLNKPQLGYHFKTTKQLIAYIIKQKLALSTHKYLKNKITIIKTQDLSKKLEIKIHEKKEYLLTYKKIIKFLKKFLKDPLQKNLIKILFVAITEKNSSKLLAEVISMYLMKNKKKHNYLLFLLKKVLTTLISLNFSIIKGIKIVITGRFNGAPRAKKKVLTLGIIPLQSFNSKISYSNTTSFTQNGTFGIKVWICEK